MAKKQAIETNLKGSFGLCLSKIWASKENEVILFEGVSNGEKLIIPFKGFQTLKMKDNFEEHYELITNKAVMKCLIEAHNEVLVRFCSSSKELAQKYSADRFIVASTKVGGI